MAGRIDLVRGMKEILGDRYFVYGGYESRETTISPMTKGS